MKEEINGGRVRNWKVGEGNKINIPNGGGGETGEEVLDSYY